MPAFVSIDAGLSFAVVEMVGTQWVNGQQVNKGAYRVILEETRNGQTATLLSEQGLRRLADRAFAVPFYSNVN